MTSDMGEITIRPVLPDDRPLIERLWQLYAHDMSQFRGTLPNAEGLYKLGRLVGYLADPVENPGYLALLGGAPAGFAFVMHALGPTHHMGDFFVARAARRRGVGEYVAHTLIERYPGPWEIAFQDNNPGAPEFWKRVVASIVGDAWREEWRPVPNKPEIASDHWLMFSVAVDVRTTL